MTRQREVLERTLRTLADDFANRVARAMMRAPVTELRDALDVGELKSVIEGALSRMVVEPAPRRPAPRKRPAPAVRGRRVVAKQERRNPPSEDEGDATITDPSLLLLAMEPEPRGNVSHVTRPSAIVTPLLSAGPTLRPGERLQRTTGGGLVLRRRGK